ncbi:MAG TPA: hypothetical protein VMY16_06945 [Ilumatobacteraceae bacterium]|nr:hypothetical protein [Ilumatobacteraceae bacterium]
MEINGVEIWRADNDAVDNPVIDVAAGVVVFDTGVGQGHPLIDNLYGQPRITPIITAPNSGRRR